MQYNKWKNVSLEDMPGEVWKSVPGYDGTMASNFGRIKSIGRYVSTFGKGNRFIPARIRSQVLSKDGYLRVDAILNGVLKKVTAHRMCALAFKPNPLNKKTVQHKNSIRHCNEEWNLGWFTQSEQLKDAYYKNRKPIPMPMLGRSGGKHPKSRSIFCVTNGKTYGSTREAARELNLSDTQISGIARGTYNAKNPKWNFKYN